MSSGRASAPAIASRAAVIIARPPLACTLSIATPSFAAAAHALATVLGMSWNLRSRNTAKPRSTIRRTGSGPAVTNSSLPTLRPQSRGLEALDKRKRVGGIGKVERDEYFEGGEFTIFSDP